MDVLILISTAVKYLRVEKCLKCSFNYLKIPESSFSYFLSHPIRWKSRTIYGYENKHNPWCRQSRHQLTVTPTFLAHYCCWSLNYVELIKSNAVTNEYWSKMLNIPACSGIWTFGWAAPLGNINPQQCNGRLLGNSAAVQRFPLLPKESNVCLPRRLKCAAARNTKGCLSELLSVCPEAFQAPGETQTHSHRKGMSAGNRIGPKALLQLNWLLSPFPDPLF